MGDNKFGSLPTDSVQSLHPSASDYNKKQSLFNSIVAVDDKKHLDG